MSCHKYAAKFWILTDTHFGHDKIREYCNRPADYNNKIIKGLACIKPKDVLIFLGDFCWGNDSAWHDLFVSACKGKRWFIRGNHDKQSNSWYLRHGWHSVVSELVLKMYGKTIVLSHEPIHLTRGEEGYDINVHGHFHNKKDHPGMVSAKQQLVYIEHNYRPIDLRKIIERKTDENK